MVRQEIDDNEISDLATQSATRGQVEAEMLAGENSGYCLRTCTTAVMNGCTVQK
jgi:hypothetical protein